MNRKADLVGGLSDDLDGHRGRRRRPISGKAHVGKGLRDERKRAAGEAQHESTTLPILTIGRLGLQSEGTSVRVHHDLALAAFHLLAGIIATPLPVVNTAGNADHQPNVPFLADGEFRSTDGRTLPLRGKEYM